VTQVDVWPWPRVLAHRCGGALAPENTLAGLEAAVRIGCRGVEFDIMLAADGVPVLIHDETLERTTDGHGRVAETSWEVLRRLDAGGWFGERFAGEPLPTLQEAATRCIELGLAVNLEIKPASGFEAETGRVAATVAHSSWRNAALPPLRPFPKPLCALLQRWRRHCRVRCSSSRFPRTGWHVASASEPWRCTSITPFSMPAPQRKCVPPDCGWLATR
jgi:hypothetical protein